MNAQRNALLKAETQVRKLARKEPVIQSMAEVVGEVTAAVIIAKLGDPNKYSGDKPNERQKWPNRICPLRAR
jgi:hypothetical protein